MRITDETLRLQDDFRNIEIGDVFRLKGNLYMKVSDDIKYIGENKVNSYSFNERDLVYIGLYEKVEPISSELILRDKEFTNECVECVR